MQIQLRGNRIPVTDALQAYTEKKLGRLTKYFEEDHETRPVTAQVLLSVLRDTQRVEVTVAQVGEQFLLRAEVTDKDMYAALDQATDKLERQIRKYKTRLHRRPRQEAAVRRRGDEVPAVGEPDSHAYEEEHLPTDIVRTKRFELKPMSPEEAVMQMELIGHTFFVFADEHTQRVNVVYQRCDGRYGLIDPEIG